MNIGPTGIWDAATPETYEFDAPLAKKIAEVLIKLGVQYCIDLGCGAGKYTEYLQSSGICTVGFDGNPNAFKMSPRCYGNYDLSRPIDLPTTDCVLSLEVGEHIPREFEMAYLDNVAKAEKFVVMSWFPIPGHGIGHVNERPNDWVIGQMESRGFSHEQGLTTCLRDSSTLWWFKESILVFSRK